MRWTNLHERMARMEAAKKVVEAQEKSNAVQAPSSAFFWDEFSASMPSATHFLGLLVSKGGPLRFR